MQKEIIYLRTVSLRKNIIKLHGKTARRLVLLLQLTPSRYTLSRLATKIFCSQRIFREDIVNIRRSLFAHELPGNVRVGRKKNIISMSCFPSHGIQYLQPLGRSFFKSLKHHWNYVRHNWVTCHKRQNGPNRRSTRTQFDELFYKACSESAVAKSAVNVFRPTGICAFNLKAILNDILDIAAGRRQQARDHSNFIFW